MALRDTQAMLEVYAAGGETYRETQAMLEVYADGQSRLHVTQSDLEVYATVAGTAPAGGRPRRYGVVMA